MEIYQYSIFERKVILKIQRRVCETSEELLESKLFSEILKSCIKKLEKHDSPLLGIFQGLDIDDKNIERLENTLKILTKIKLDLIPKLHKEYEVFTKDRTLLYEFVEYLYNYWRDYDRFVICNSAIEKFDQRPYRTFNDTVEKLTHLIRGTYRDIQENITGKHPKIYRQVRAGSEVAGIALPKKINMPKKYADKLKDVPIIRQTLLYPPLVLNPPMNKRTGRFEPASSNPIDIVNINPGDWLCYPAKVGPLNVHIYFNRKFYELGFSLCNLFELVEDHELEKKPDAIYLYGVEQSLNGIGPCPTIFYDDKENDMLVAAVPGEDRFGYFGYLKKMVLTLHNIKMMKKGRFPFHGAMVNILLNNGKRSNIIIIGDTGAGKSETLEAFRVLADEYIRNMIIIADDMGSINIEDGKVKGYGTEIGAFLRLDDLPPGYAFGQIDRAIIMSPNLTNSRIILPVTSIENVLQGWDIDIILYANNYENIDSEHKTIEYFKDPKEALRVFREGTVMSKGTTTSEGITHSYFANIFGPPQYKDMHEALAEKYFHAFFEKNIQVGQMRTMLGVKGFEIKGPENAAKKLLGELH